MSSAVARAMGHDPELQRGGGVRSRWENARAGGRTKE